MHYRPAVPSDAPRLSEIYAPFVQNTAITFAETPMTAAAFEQKMQSIYPVLVCEVDGQVAGYAYAAAFREKAAYRWAVEPSIYIDPAFHGQGIGKGLMERLLHILQLQGFCSVYSCITQPNEKSMRLHRHFGFEEVGRFPACGYKQNQWHDVVWLRLPLSNAPAHPEEPIPFHLLPAQAWQKRMEPSFPGSGCVV